MQLKILYEDNHLLVIDKQAGLLSQADKSGSADALTLAKKYIKAKYNKPGEVFLGLVHRLDKPVSGVLVFARTSKAASRLTQQFKERRVEKTYLAIVEGVHTGKGTCVDWLRKTGERVHIVSADKPGARQARLSWHAVASTHERTLLRVQLETGRPHQIRVQLSARGMSILGDSKYGARLPWAGNTLALHCVRLSLVHPTRKGKLSFVSRPGGSWPDLFATHIDALARPELD